MVEQMKPSGIAWIGDIPKDWDISKFKYSTDIIMGQSPDSKSIKEENGKYLFMQGNAEFTEIYPQPTLYCDYPNRTSRIGDILMSVRAPVGAMNISDKIYGIGRGLCSISANRFDRKYLWYFMLKSKEDFQFYSNGSTFEAITTENLSNFPIITPPIEDQQAIADYLDAQCAKIDSITADLEKQIELLQKYKKSLITETVTKGLDKSVPMKDSGIEWIGKVPCTWEVNRLRYASTIKTGPFGTQLSADEYAPEGIPIINVKNIGYGSILSDDLDFIPEPVADRLSEHRLRKNDIVFGRKGAVDKHAIISKQFENWVQGSDCIRVRCDASFDARYLNYLFDSTYFSSHVLLYAVGATMPSMSSEILLNAKVLVPPIEEQNRIADYLDDKCSAISTIIAGKVDELDRIKSYKKSLIYEYVTGKKRVKEVP